MHFFKLKDGSVQGFDNPADAPADAQEIPTEQFAQIATQFQPAPPQSVSRAQGKAALIQAGKWEQVTAYIAGITDPTQQALADVALNDTQDWRRDSPFLNQAATAIGLKSAGLDALFEAAAQIVL